MQSYLEFWLDFGVDGFILSGIEAMFEVDEILLDEPISEVLGTKVVSIIFLS